MSSVQQLPQLFPGKETAQMIGVAPATLPVWRCTKRYPLKFVRVGRKIMYRLEDIQEFLAARTCNGDGTEARPRRRARRAAR